MFIGTIKIDNGDNEQYSKSKVERKNMKQVQRKHRLLTNYR